MKNALILVDIQNDYFEGGKWPVSQMDRVGRNAAMLLADARNKGQLVVHVHHEMPEGGPFFVAGTEGAAINAIVAPQDGEATILKHRPNSFHQTGLEQMLRDHGIDAVTICGAMSQMCIDATARAARDFGFDVTVVEDACGARDVSFAETKVPAAQVHATIMGALNGSYAKVVTTQGYLGG
ncbi:MAG: cysteine hydrolase [Rhodobacterales bacterium]|nr:cysteine hydrolase [Rhodobacterales bacterium]MDX5391086.1 cysteine hydrolase [Rhodobacterales bacterium]MDX5490781.1 cysteine hydrolase [Rhodobacterales bacterium]